MRSPAAEAVRRDYTRLARRYERRWRVFNSVVREWVLARWPALPAGACVLDLGCGTGAFLAAIAARAASLTLVGLDLTPALLAEARREVPAAKLVEADADAPPLVHGAFDVVCSLNVLHHLRAPERHVAVLADLCRSGGTVFLCTFAGGSTLRMRLLDEWLRHRNAGWRGMCSPDELDRAIAQEPRLEVHERGTLSAGVWQLQILRLEK